MNIYEDRYVFFIDILGFSSEVKSCLSDQARLGNIFNALKKISQHNFDNKNNVENIFKHIKGNSDFDKSDFHVLTFSDSIIFSCKKPEGITVAIQIVYYIREIMLDLAKMGLLVRGAAHVGNLIHDKSGVMFGPAFNEAYHLESKVAVYPRVLISRDFMLHLSEASGSTITEILDAGFTKKCDDGPYMIDQFSWVTRSSGDERMWVNIIIILEKIIIKMDENIENLDVYKKYVWYLREFKKTIISHDEYKINEINIFPFLERII